MFDCKQYLIPWRAGMPVLVKVKGEFRIYHAYRMITEKYADIRRRMAEKRSCKGQPRSCWLCSEVRAVSQGA